MHPEDAMKFYQARLALHDFDALLPVIAEDAVFWFSDGDHKGIEAARRAFEAAWKAVENEVYTLEDLRWLAIGDSVASCIYNFHWKGMAAGEPVWGGGRGTTVLRKDAAGWRIVHEHLSPANAFKTAEA